MRVRLGSMFSGYGGLDLALAELLGAETVFVADVCKVGKDGTVDHHEPHRSPCSILAHRFPDAPNLGDVSLIDWTPWRGRVDIIAAGFPCQDVSVAGNRAGLKDGTRTGLWSQVVRAIASLQPRLVVLENVPGLLSGGTDSYVSNDTCVCGWPYRRGGLHCDLREQGSDLLSQRDGGDDREGFADLGATEVEARREGHKDTRRDGTMGRGVGVGGLRRRSNGGSEGDPTSPGPQGRAGSHCAEGGRDQSGVASAMDEAERGPAGAEVDRGGEQSLRDPQAPDARVEREGAERTYDVTGREVTHCEACGRCLGNESSRPAERSWMGVVQRDLAALGFDADWTVVPASGVGAPHKRERWFCAAYPAGQPWSFEHGDGGETTADTARRLRGWSRGLSPRPPEGTERQEGGSVGRSGGTHSRPTPAVALLPTPAVNDMGAAYTPDEWDAWTSEMKAKHGNGNGHGKSLNVEAQRLLPTPTVQDGANNGGPSQFERNSLPLNAEVLLLPSPMAGDAKMARNSTAERRSEPPTGVHAGDTLGDITHALRWGEYEPAIRRWEALTRPAPEPTKLNAKGNPKLSDEFDEWLMGLPAGWITDVPGVTWNEALKACGNGVVPQQAAAALRWLLSVEVAA